jgi:hypothetical protein
MPVKIKWQETVTEGSRLHGSRERPTIEQPLRPLARFLDARWIILGRRERRPSDPWVLGAFRFSGDQ